MEAHRFLLFYHRGDHGCSLGGADHKWAIKVVTVALVTLALVPFGGLLAGASQAEEKAFFETGTVAPSDGGDFAINAYPVIARLQSGALLCVWTAARKGVLESYRIVGALSHDNGKTWGAPALLFQGNKALEADPNIVLNGRRVLVFSTTVPLPLKIEKTQIWMKSSDDLGETWSAPLEVPMPHRYVAGKIHVGHRLPDGTLIMGYAYDTWAEQGMIPATEGEMDIKSGVLRSRDGGRTWMAGGDLYVPCIPKSSPHSVSGLDEPSTVVLKDGTIAVLLRSAGTRLFQSRSRDGGLTWEKPEPSPLTSHNAPAALWRLEGPEDEILVVWDNSPRSRAPLCAALSRDGARSWSAPKVLSSPPAGVQASYPSATQASDGALVAVWQEDLPEGRGREIRIARFNRAWLLGQ